MIYVSEVFLTFLQHYKKAKILLLELEQVNSLITYEQFAHIIFDLEEQGFLVKVKSSGVNNKTPTLAYEYKIQKYRLKQLLQEQIKQAKIHFHAAIYIEVFLTNDLQEWEEAYPRLLQLNDYLQQGFPIQSSLVSDRSYEIFQDEKYIMEHGGKQLLEKVRVWDQLNIMWYADPIAFAVNINELHKPIYQHLIVENKATYMALLPALQQTQFTTLIYGEGNAITSTITSFNRQLPLKGEAQYYYFGDIDRAGIEIWYRLTNRINVQLALPFYEACLMYPYSEGKLAQRKNDEAIAIFIQQFAPSFQQKITKMLAQGGYLPQEVLQQEQLQRIWRDSEWHMETY